MDLHVTCKILIIIAHLIFHSLWKYWKKCHI